MINTRSWPVRRLNLCLPLALGLLLSACGDSAPPAAQHPASTTAQTAASHYSPEIQALYHQALDAGDKEVVLYTAFPDTIDLWAAFNRDFPGITLRPSMADQIYTRLASEQSSGNHIGDVVLTGYSELSELVRQQRLQKDTPASSAGLPAQYLDPAGYFQLPWVNAFTVGYNTQRLKAQEVPDTWAEILDPQRKNTFAHVRFYGASPFDAAVILLQEENKLSDADLHTLHDNAQVADNPGSLISNLAQGRTSFVLWAPAQGLARMRDSGAPIGLAFPKDVAILYGPGVALIRQAPHPAAAALFKNWLFSPQAQAIIAEREYAYGTVPGSPAPKGFPDIGTFQQKFIPYDQVNAYFDRYRQKTAAIWK